MRVEAQLREAQRTGDRVGELRARLRAGTLTKDNLDLAAWCSDEAAVRITGYMVETSLGPWLGYLARWPSEVRVMASVAAARAAWACMPCVGCDVGIPGLHEKCGPSFRVIAAAEAWIACPSEDHLAAWERSLQVRLPLWVPVPEHHTPASHGRVHCPEAEAARAVGKSAVREAIRRSLIAWALAA